MTSVPVARRRILSVGMLPPPLSGQALMFDRATRLLAQSYEVDVLNIQVQDNIGNSGAMSFSKLLLFAGLSAKCLFYRLLKGRYDAIYYCPSGPNNIGVLKDLAFLSLLRGGADRLVYHFHATGAIDYILKQNAFIRWWASKAMFAPEAAIRCAAVQPNDAALSGARRDIILYNGIDDPLGGDVLPPIGDPQRPRFCFIGALIREKGVFDLIEVARILRGQHPHFVLDIIGEGTAQVIRDLEDLIAQHGLQNHVILHGIKTGKAKFDILRQATLFLFPTYFRAETQPLVAIEAAALGVPTVASDWRGLDTIVIDGDTGALAPPRHPEVFAAKVVSILQSGRLQDMRLAARHHYLANFTTDRFLQRLDATFAELLDEAPAKRPAAEVFAAASAIKQR